MDVIDAVVSSIFRGMAGWDWVYGVLYFELYRFDVILLRMWLMLLSRNGYVCLASKVVCTNMKRY